MKILAIICLVAFASASVSAQVQQDKMYYAAKAQKFRNMKKTAVSQLWEVLRLPFAD